MQAAPDLRPAELLEAMDPTPAEPDPIIMPREAWLSLVHTGHAETQTHIWIWHADGICRLSKIWIGHPDLWRHWQDVILFREEVKQ